MTSKKPDTFEVLEFKDMSRSLCRKMKRENGEKVIRDYAYSDASKGKIVHPKRKTEHHKLFADVTKAYKVKGKTVLKVGEQVPIVKKNPDGGANIKVNKTGYTIKAADWSEHFKMSGLKRRYVAKGVDKEEGVAEPAEEERRYKIREEILKVASEEN